MNNDPHIAEGSDDAERTEGVQFPSIDTSDRGETFATAETTTPTPIFYTSFGFEASKLFDTQNNILLHPDAIKQFQEEEAAKTKVVSLAQKLKEATTGVESKKERCKIISRVVRSYVDSRETPSPAVESIHLKCEVSSPAVESIKTKCEVSSPAVESSSQKKRDYFAVVVSSLRSILNLSTTVENASKSKKGSSTAVEDTSINSDSHSTAVESSSQNESMLSPAVEDTSQNETTLSPAVESTSPKKHIRIVKLGTPSLLDEIEFAIKAKAIRFEAPTTTGRIQIRYPEQPISVHKRRVRPNLKQVTLLNSVLHFMVGCVSTLHALSAFLDSVIVATSGSKSDHNANTSRRSTLRPSDYHTTWTTHQAPVYYQSHTITHTHNHNQAFAVAYKTRTAYAAVFLHSFYHSVAISPTAGRAPPPNTRWKGLSIDIPNAASWSLAA